MTAATFDTHQFVKELTSAGFTEAQAEVMTSVMGRAREGDGKEVATRQDLAVTEANLRRELAELRSELLKWIIGLLGLQTVVVIGSIAGLLRTFVH